MWVTVNLLILYVSSLTYVGKQMHINVTNLLWNFFMAFYQNYKYEAEWR